MAKRGETREIIINAATKVFFKYGFERTSVKMILEEAGVVTGSFYHFFPSKEDLFEAVIEKYLRGYSQRIGDILCDESRSMEQIVDKFLEEHDYSREEIMDGIRSIARRQGVGELFDTMLGLEK